MTGKSVYLKVAENTGDNDRSVEITFRSKNRNLSEKVVITQRSPTPSGYVDGVLTIKTAGAMKQLLGDDWLNIISLKIMGPINGDDVRCLRQMLGGSEFVNAEEGKLTSLDLSETSIVKGGGKYLSGFSYNTSNDAIGMYMFSDCTNLQDIVLPIGITSIDSNAFRGCSSLTSIKIPNGVTAIGEGAFYDCSSLTSIDIPDSVTLIGQQTFDGCYSLKSVHITDLSAWCNITFSTSCANPLSRGAKLYLNNNELTELVIPVDIKQINNYAFSGCSSLTSIDIPNGVTSIASYAFYNCFSLPSIKIPNGVTAIGKRAFYNCSSLTSIKIPNGVTAIGEGAFFYCSSLTSIDIPDSVTSIEDYTFYNCSSLTSIDIPDSVIVIGSYAFSDCSSLTSIDIPNGVKSIETASFKGCSSLTSITMGDRVTSIGSAFSDCYSLKSVHITDLSAWCNITFSTSSANPLSRGAKLYLNNNELTELVIPVDIKQIKNYAFYGCKSITKVTIGEQVTLVGIQSFRDCSSLTQIYCQGTTPPTINSSATNSSFNGASSDKTLYAPKGHSSKYKSSNWASFFATIKEMD